MSQQSNILRSEDELLPELNISMGQLLLMQLTTHGTRIAHINPHTGKEQTYQHILDTSRKLAVYLQREGLKTNDTVAVCSENNLEFCIPVCAAFYLGAIACPLNPLYSERELKHALSISKPKYIFISKISLSGIRKIFRELHWSPKILMLTDGSNNVSWTSMYKVISNVSNDDANALQAAPVNLDDHVTAILCSSGTTGLPKGVMLTDKNITTVIRMFMNTNAIQENGVSLSLLPFFHAYSFVLMVLTILRGNCSIVFSRFEEELFLQYIEKYRIEYMPMVPSLMVFLAKHPLVDKYDLSCVKTIWSGAAPLSKEIQQAVAKRLNMNITDVKQGYGLTETTLAVLRSPDGKAKLGSVGVVVPGTLAKIIPIGEYETDKTLGPNCEGELCFKGDLIMKGYYNDEESTKATIDKDGWLHTGDVGYYDEDGYFYIVDRIKELIKYKGYQVPPAELEAILLTFPGIQDAAVIGIPNDKSGELPMAFIVKEKNSNICEKDIIQYVNERVSNPKRLRGGIRFVDSIPKTPSEFRLSSVNQLIGLVNGFNRLNS
ncbi:PREDICTED: luciferin 4-monooxygenase-like [Trachymyrmex septentrionalis]|uniref:luciferin 4-monooxygenase-like n=1 Tax=Trachymyrmex septentrionalis TaxID=34720 RepID=UPI00084F7939|nr:PREDICTED: luciferin 4-monooxygenase-like [Trachymyrmex septentrionalis]